MIKVLSRYHYIYKGILALLITAVCLITAGCGNDTPEMTEKEVTEGLSNSITETFKFDKISNITYNAVETSEDEMTVLKGKFQNQVPYKTYLCYAELENLDMTAKVSYRLLCAYNNGWSVISATEWDKDKWEYKAKKYPSERDIMRDISKYKFGSFDVGYVGDERTSAVKIKEAVFDEAVNRETEDISVEIKTDFGHYEVDAKVIYYFLNGEWTLGDFSYGEMKDWNFIYNDGCELDLLTEDQIIENVTDKNNFLTYCTNKAYTKDYSVEFEYMDATKDEMTGVFSFKASYGFGNIEYKVKAIYKWLDYEWSECEPKTAVSKTDFSPALNVEYKKDEKTITIVDTHPISDDEINSYRGSNAFKGDNALDKSASIITFVYKAEGKTYTIKACEHVPLRDNNWDTVVISIEKDNEADEELTIDKLSFDTEHNAIVVNGEVFLSMV